jgi:uncharacterized protein YjbI with pentapeptide repeats
VVVPFVLAAAVSFTFVARAEQVPQPAAPEPIPVAILELALVDRSPIADPAAARAKLAESGKTPAAWLAETFAASGAYRVIDQASVARALQEMGTTADVCAEAGCALRLGQAVKAARVVYGTMIKVSTLISYADAALVDVAAGRVLRREELEIKGDIAQLLPHAMPSMARRLAEADPLVARRIHQRKRLSREEVTTFLATTSDNPPPDLTDVDLSGLDLEGVDFKRADLSRSNLSHTRLRGARMFAVKLTDAVATGADLTSAVLDLGVLERADLTGAVLQQASLYAAILTDVVLVDADLRRARVIAPMAGARLSHAKLADADLGADPGNQPMGIMRTDASSADLSGADLTGANLRKVNFSRADLTGADLTSADVAGADFTGAILRSIRGRSEMRGVSRAKNFHPPE